MNTDGKTRIKKLISRDLILLAAGTTYVFFVRISGLAVPCIFHKITGFKCPGCGITRGIMALLYGDIKQAYSYNPYLFCVSPVIIYLLIKGDMRYIRYDSFQLARFDTIITYACIVGAVVFWFLRNIKGI